MRGEKPKSSVPPVEPELSAAELGSVKLWQQKAQKYQRERDEARRDVAELKKQLADEKARIQALHDVHQRCVGSTTTHAAAVNGAVETTRCPECGWYLFKAGVSATMREHEPGCAYEGGRDASP